MSQVPTSAMSPLPGRRRSAGRAWTAVAATLAACAESAAPTAPRDDVELVDECDEPLIARCDPLATCIDQREGYRCSPCPLGTRDVNGDGTKCEPITSCVERFGFDPCDPLAGCIVDGTGLRCGACPQGYDDLRGDGTLCPNIDECEDRALNDCAATVRCVDLPGGFACRGCIEGYRDPTGDGRCVNVDECQEDSTLCRPYGTCVDVQGSFVCRCAEGFVPELGRQACGPLVQAMEVDGGVLDPPFDPLVSAYALRIAGGTRTATFAVRAREGVRVRITTPWGRPEGSGGRFSIPVASRIARVVLEAELESVRLVYDIQPLGVQYVKAPDPRPGDALGSSIAAAPIYEFTSLRRSASAALVAVGVPGADVRLGGDTLEGSGAVLVGEYLGLGSESALAWTDRLAAPYPGAADRFGEAVALWSFDTEDELVPEQLLAVGAPGEDSDGRGPGGVVDNDLRRDSGAVYVFSRRSAALGSPPLQRFGEASGLRATLKASDAAESDEFGASVAAAWPVQPTAFRPPDRGYLVVGAPGKDDDAGAAYLFRLYNASAERPLGGFEQVAVLRAASPRAGARFGQRVALSEDVVVVGFGGPTGGGFELFQYSGTEVRRTTPSALVTTAAPTGLSADGQRAAIADGRLGLADRDGSGWTVRALGGPASAVALRGVDLVAGDPLDASAGRGVNPPEAAGQPPVPESGGAVLLRRSAGLWGPAHVFKAPNRREGDRFGHGVALARVDAGLVVFVTAPGEDGGAGGPSPGSGAADSGALYVFDER